jgi:hypothetical protein
MTDNPCTVEVKVTLPCCHQPESGRPRIVFEVGPFEDDPGPDIGWRSVDVFPDLSWDTLPQILDVSKFTGELKNKQEPQTGEVTMGTTMTVMQRTTVRIKRVVDGKGNEIPVMAAGDPAWATDNDNLLFLTTTPDGVIVRAVGPTGSALVNCSVMTDKGEVTGSFGVTLLPGPPAAVELEADAPVDDLATTRSRTGVSLGTTRRAAPPTPPASR